MKNVFPCLLLLPIFVTGCSSSSSEQQEKISRMDSCEKVNSLIAAAPEGFPMLKGRQVSTKYLTSWQATAHLVGDDCQVIENNQGQHQYICSAQYSSYDEATKIHEEALSLVQRCLDQSWAASTEKAERRDTITLSSPQSEARILLTLGKGFDKKRPWIINFKVLDD